MDKDQILKDAVKRLLGLNIPDKEIIENLKSVGVTEVKARAIIAEMKGVPSSAKQEAPLEPKQQKPAREEEPEDIYGQVYDELEQEQGMKTPVIQKQINNPSYSAPVTDKGMSELWEKGILATVDSRLQEIKILKEELDSVLDQKIGERMKLEIKKIETVFDSQKTLLNSKIDSHLDEKSNEVKKVIEARARQMEDIYAKVQQEFNKVQAEKKMNKELLDSIGVKLEGVEGIKSKMISETNSSIIQMESKFRDFMDNSVARRDEIEQRINRALELESKITEGLIQNARQKIDSLSLEKQDELTAMVQDKIKELDKMTAEVDPKGINDRLIALKELEKEIVKRQKQIDSEIDKKFEGVKKEFSEYKKEIAKLEESNFDELKKEYAANVDELFAENITAWDKKLKEKKKEIDDLKSRWDVEELKATMESLDLFKKQFINTIKKSVEDYNKTKTELADIIIQRDKAINDYLKKIDVKMQEFSEFEKQFSKDVAELLDKVPAETEKKKVK